MPNTSRTCTWQAPLRTYASILPPEAPRRSLESMTAEWLNAFDNPSFRAFLAEDGNLPVGTVAI